MDRITLFKQYLDEKHNTTIVHEHYLNTLREYAPGTDLYMREMHFIISADPENPVSISDLASSLDVTLGAASQMATKLEKKGLVSRFPDPGDGGGPWSASRSPGRGCFRNTWSMTEEV